jgi:hypothetical protein
MHLAVVFCLYIYDCFAAINSNHERADFFWMTRSCKSFFKMLQENNQRPKCFDFYCIKGLAHIYRPSRNSNPILELSSI